MSCRYESRISAVTDYWPKATLQSEVDRMEKTSLYRRLCVTKCYKVFELYELVECCLLRSDAIKSGRNFPLAERKTAFYNYHLQNLKSRLREFLETDKSTQIEYQGTDHVADLSVDARIK
jgi:hypothetical protein